MFQKSDESILNEIAKIDGLGNKARARQILTWLKVDEPSILLILEEDIF